MTNITFTFETSTNTKPKEKKVGWTWHIISPRPKKVGGHVLRLPHQIAPMGRMNFPGAKCFQGGTRWKYRADKWYTIEKVWDPLKTGDVWNLRMYSRIMLSSNICL